MPDLESMIEDWRHRMADGGLRDPHVLEELEGHLREDIAARMAAGADAGGAFQAGAASLGAPEALTAEFFKLGGSLLQRFKPAWFVLAAIPPSHQPPVMNTTDPLTRSEPCWATYTRAAISLTPAVLLCTFAVMYLMPRLELICQRAGVRLPGIYHAGVLVADHPALLLLIAVLPFAMLEWRWSRWHRFRRASVGSIVLLLNAAAMTFMTAMVIYALLAAPNLAGHAP